MLVSAPEQDNVRNEPGSQSYDVWHDALTTETAATEPWHLLVRRQLDPSRDLASHRVLEIGRGRRGFSCWLAGQARPHPSILAIDYSAVAVEKGRAHAAVSGSEGVTWQTGDIQGIHNPDASFDTVTSCETIGYVSDPPGRLRELARVLKSDCGLFLTTPNYFGPFGLYRAHLRLRRRRFTEMEPINRFTILPRTLRWIRRAGLATRTVAGEGHTCYGSVRSRNVLNDWIVTSSSSLRTLPRRFAKT
jgi:ubiquinone/menaquinone biosynthesis C-methylase UbiE